MNAIEDLRDIVNDFESDNLINRRVKEDIMRWIDSIEAEYMELPKDKNGEVIHLGDRIRGYSGSVGKVIALKDSGDVIISRDGYTAHVTADTYELVKVETDSMERIKADAKKSLSEYWNCGGARCVVSECPALIDGKLPHEYYGTDRCVDVIKLDLIARTEKLLGGEK